MYLSWRMLVIYEGSGVICVGGGGFRGTGEGVVCHVLGMFVIYIGVYGVGVVVYALFLAIKALGSERKNVVMWACCGV